MKDSRKEDINDQMVLKRYQDLGITLWTEQGNLCYSGPKNVLTEEQKYFLKQNKNRLIVELGKKEAHKQTGRKTDFPLTDIQSAYFVGRMGSFDYGNVSCKIYLEMIYDSLERERVQTVWNHLIRRHDMLRAVIKEGGYQTLEAEVPEFTVKEIVIEPDREELLGKIRAEMAEHTFAIGTWPYFAISLSRHADHTMMHVAFDFLIADWNSIWILLREFEEDYFSGAGEKEGRQTEFGQKLSFPAYLEKEREWMKGDRYLADKKYWEDRVMTLPPKPQIPLLGKEQLKNRFVRKFYQLPCERWEAFKAKAGKYGVTPTAAIMSAYGLCLSKWSNSLQFALNLTMLNRLPIDPDVNQIVGDFTTVSLLEMDYSKDKTFAETAREHQTRMSADLDHRLFSGVKVMREISKRRGKEDAFFPYVFTGAIGLVNPEGGKGRIGEYGISQTPQVFIDCQAMDSKEGLRLNWDIREGVFREDMAEDMFRAFVQFLEHLTEREEYWEVSARIELPAHQQKIRDSVNHTEKIFREATLYEIVAEQITKQREKIAVIDEWESVTYQELGTRVLAIGRELDSYGCIPGTNVGILLSKGVNQIAAVLAVLAARAVYVPIEPDQPVKRMKLILQEAHISLVLTEKQEEFPPDAGYRAINLSDIDFAQKWMPQKETRPNPADLAYIIFTSGSTGRPKGVQITHRAACNTILDINQRFGIRETDSVLALSKLNFDLSVYDIFGILSVGGTVVFPDRDRYLDPSHWMELIEKHKITVWNTVPAFMEIFLEYVRNHSGSPGLKTILLSGDWIPIRLPETIWNHIPKAKVISLGGATEASIWSNYYVCSKEDTYEKSIPYGYPLSNQRFRIKNEKGEEVPDFVPGELCIEGAGLSTGYMNEDEMTRQQFVESKEGERMYRTGDFGYYEPDGKIVFLGRRDQQIKLHGYRIELGEVEAALKNIPGVAEACAVIAGSDGKPEAILGVVVPQTGEAAQETDLVDILCHEEPGSCQKEEMKKEDQKREDIEKALENRDKAAIFSVLRAFREYDLLLPDRQYTVKEITEASCWSEKNKWVLRYLLNALLKNGLLKRDENETLSCRVQVTEDEFEQYCIQMKDSYRNIHMNAIASYMDQAFHSLGRVLAGVVNPVTLLYPQGSTDILTELYQENPVAQKLNKKISEVVARVAGTKEKIRILEIGAGSGATSFEILSGRRDGTEYEYIFSDVSENFLLTAKENLSRFENVRYKKFNMDEDYREQGFLPNSFDIIVASGVIENAKRIGTVLESIREMLKPNGYLLCTEPVREEPWILASQAVMMTAPEDACRADCLYLEETEWMTYLEQTGSGTLSIYPAETSDLSLFGMKLYLKQWKAANAELDGDKLQKQLSGLLPDYMVPKQIQVIDHMPLTGNGKINRRRIGEWYVSESASEPESGQNQRTEENEQLQELKEIVEHSLGIQNMNTNKSLYEYGADSLVQAQIAGKVKTLLEEHGVYNVTFDSILRKLLNGAAVSDLYEFMTKSGTMRQQPMMQETEQQAEQKTMQRPPLGELQVIKDTPSETVRVVLPPGLGTMSSLQDLVGAMSAWDGRILGITVKDSQAYCALRPEVLIRTVAEEYANYLKQEEFGQVQLIGYCMGGFLAVEIAKRLSESGVRVKEVVLIDSVPVSYDISDELILEAIYLTNYEITIGRVFAEVEDSRLLAAIRHLFELHQKKLPPRSHEILRDDPDYASEYAFLCRLNAMSQEERFRLYAKALRDETDEEVLVETILAGYRIYAHSFLAARADLEPYFGDIRLLQAKEAMDYLFIDQEQTVRYWEEHCIGELEVIPVNGNHGSCVEQENAEQLARLICRN